MYMVDK